ncbi:MAG TPA: FHA domain-containing protein [Spirochaetia bacterium]|nr:FHA domain-containing protein [Spirochaetia bacterium]
MSKKDKTLSSQSVVGQRLSKVSKTGGMFLVFQNKNIPVISRITIGRESSNVIELDDALSSRFHAVVQKIKNGYFIQDLSSTNGTRVNGQPVPPGKYVRLTAGDTILIGRTRLSLHQFGL